MSGFSKILPAVHKIRAAINRGRKSSSRDKHTNGHFSSIGLDIDTLTPSPWNLPIEIQILIFAHCGAGDYLSLKLVCKAFSEILRIHEHEIVRQYLRERRHGTLPSPIDSERTYTRNPEDDVVLLSDLFPPSKSARGGHLYTFRYLLGLQHRQKLCSRLCYYLADRIMDRFIQTQPMFRRTSFPVKKTDRTSLVRRARMQIWFHLAPLMYYTLYFLESFNSARAEHTNMLLREHEAGRLRVPVSVEIRKRMYGELQAAILRQPPFTNTAALIATHHCIYLLVNYIRHTMASEGEPDDSWITSLLTLSPFERIVEFFSAEIGDGGSQRMQRKDFMYNFYADTKHAREHLNTVLFGRTSEQNMHSSVRDLWFDVARSELESRNAIPHDIETVWSWEGIPILFGCPDCHHKTGWRA